MRFAWLNQYPNLRKFCLDNQVAPPQAPRRHHQFVLQDVVAQHPTAQSAHEFHLRRAQLDRALCLAYRHDILNRDLRTRLLSRDYVEFEARLAELKVGLWLERRGFTITWHPPAAHGGKGEFEISEPTQVFVEVKSMFRPRAMSNRGRTLDRIAQILECHQLPAERITLLEDSDSFCESALVEEVSRAEPNTVVCYRDPSGLHLEISIAEAACPVAIKDWTGWVETPWNLLDTLEASQRSPKDIPNLVVVNDPFHRWNALDIPTVLYGRHTTDFSCPDRPRDFRAPGGLWEPKKSSFLSAVATYSQRFNEDILPLVRIYLCPQPEFAFPATYFARHATILGLASDGIRIREY